jgi:hypothetical protein
MSVDAFGLESLGKPAATRISVTFPLFLIAGTLQAASVINLISQVPPDCQVVFFTVYLILQKYELSYDPHLSD